MNDPLADSKDVSVIQTLWTYALIPGVLVLSISIILVLFHPLSYAFLAVVWPLMGLGYFGWTATQFFRSGKVSDNKVTWSDFLDTLLLVPMLVAQSSELKNRFLAIGGIFIVSVIMVWAHTVARFGKRKEAPSQVRGEI